MIPRKIQGRTGFSGHGRTLKKIETNAESAGKLFRTALHCLEGSEPKPGKECGVCG